jgi:hypothetical protein
MTNIANPFVEARGGTGSADAKNRAKSSWQAAGLPPNQSVPRVLLLGREECTSPEQSPQESLSKKIKKINHGWTLMNTDFEPPRHKDTKFLSADCAETRRLKTGPFSASAKSAKSADNLFAVTRRGRIQESRQDLQDLQDTWWLIRIPHLAPLPPPGPICGITVN